MKILEINTTNNSYPILIGTNVLDKLNDKIIGYDKILLLSNKNVGKLYKDIILNNITDKEVFYFEIEDGECYKSIDTCMKIYDFIIDNLFTRNSLILCLGGGVICDLGGYIAATYMRGIDFIQIPTSLLAQVDASIGGKVAINHSKGKNLIGAFKQPKAVFINIDFLSTLSDIDFKSGMGEVIKHSLIDSTDEYYNFLLENYRSILNKDSNSLISMVEKSCKIKKSIVEIDEFETGVRALLNLGHTYGHCLETMFGYKNISHGEAISKGIIFEALISEKLGLINSAFIKKLYNIFELFYIDCNPIKLLEEPMLTILKKDKKNLSSNINFILFHGKKLENNSVSIDIILDVNKNIKNHYVKAVIDIGTNSCRLFIAVVERTDNELIIERKLLKMLEITKLGEGVNKTHTLSNEAIGRTVSVLKKFYEISVEMGVTEIKAFATSATRDSKNKDEFISLVKKEAHIDITCISGDLEAKLSFSGSVSIFNEDILIIDIGGGSTEFILGKNKEIHFLKSFNIGAVRATEKFFKNENYSDENIDLCIEWIKANLSELSDFYKLNFKLVGVAGTVTTNVSVLEKMEVYDTNKVHLYELQKQDIKNNLNLFLSKTLEERKKIKGLEPKRADVIIAGNIILLTIMNILKKDSITISESDNLEGGMIYENLSLHC